MDAIFKALNDPHRRAILDALRDRDGQTLTEIEARLPMTRFGAMAHLKVLEEAGLVVPRRVGRFKHHYLNALPLQEVVDRWVAPLLKPATRAVIDLKRHLEGQAMLDLAQKPDYVSETWIRCSQDALWAALTDPQQIPHYHFLSNAARGRLDAAGDAMDFLMPDGSTMLSFRATAIDPKSRIDLTFEPGWGEDRTPSRVVYHVAPMGGACKLTIEHFGLSAGQQGVPDGWARLVSGLKSYLETGRPERFDMALMGG